MREGQKRVEMEKKERGEYSLDGETTISNFSVLKSSLSFPKLGTCDLGID